jgi:transcriptional regulator with XRE-family HTH domain
MQYDGKKIRSLREAQGWSMGELARRVGIKQPSLWAMEHQVTKKPKHETMVAIAAALGVTLKAIYPDRLRKKDLPTEEHLTELFDALDDGNKQALVAAAEVMLKNQRGTKRP